MAWTIRWLCGDKIPIYRSMYRKLQLQRNVKIGVFNKYCKHFLGGYYFTCPFTSFSYILSNSLKNYLKATADPTSIGIQILK